MSPFFVTVFSFYTHISKYSHTHSARRPNVVALLVDYSSK